MTCAAFDEIFQVQNPILTFVEPVSDHCHLVAAEDRSVKICKNMLAELELLVLDPDRTVNDCGKAMLNGLSTIIQSSVTLEDLFHVLDKLRKALRVFEGICYKLTARLDELISKGASPKEIISLKDQMDKAIVLFDVLEKEVQILRSACYFQSKTKYLCLTLLWKWAAKFLLVDVSQLLPSRDSLLGGEMRLALLSMLLFGLCACGGDSTELVFVEAGSGGTITADRMRFEDIEEDYGSFGVIYSKGTLFKAKMNFYLSGSVVASFPVKIQASGNGLTMAVPMVVHSSSIKAENISGKPVSEILGTYKGTRDGIGMFYGKSHMVVRNDFDVKLQILQEKSPFFEVDWSYVNVKVVPQDTTALAWNSVIDIPEQDHSAF